MIEKFLVWLERILPSLVAAIIILIVGFIITKITLRIMRKGLERSRIDVTAHAFLLSLTKTILYTFIIIICLSALSVPMGSIVAAVGAAGLAVGLALQNSLSNLAGGFIILFSKPFSKGDYVDIGNNSGTVDEISILYTSLVTSDNKTIHIPNGQITSSSITNYTQQHIRRLDMNFTISYNADYKQAIKIINDIALNNPKTLFEPELPLVRMSAHLDSSIQLVAKIWVSSDDYWSLNYDMLEQVKDAFDKNRIDIPYNQMEVHVIDE